MQACPLVTGSEGRCKTNVLALINFSGEGWVLRFEAGRWESEERARAGKIFDLREHLPHERPHTIVGSVGMME